MLKQTEALKNTYETPLITGTITDAQLRELLVSPSSEDSLFKSCKKSPAESAKKTRFKSPKQLLGTIFSKKSHQNQDNDHAVSDNNFGVMDGMKDFVLHTAPMMSAAILHDITARLIRLSPDEIEKNTYMRNANLVKVFLAYELYAFPDNAQKNLAAERMQYEFSGTNDIANLRRVILEPSVAFFEDACNKPRAPFIEEPIPNITPITSDIIPDSDLSRQKQDIHSNHELPLLPVELPQESASVVFNALNKERDDTNHLVKSQTEEPKVIESPLITPLPVELTHDRSPLVTSSTNNSNHQRLPLKPTPVAPDLLASSGQIATVSNKERDEINHLVKPQAVEPTRVESSLITPLPVASTHDSSPLVTSSTNQSSHQRPPLKPTPVAPDLLARLGQIAAITHNERDKTNHAVKPCAKEPKVVESPVIVSTPTKKIMPFKETPLNTCTKTATSPILTKQPPLELIPSAVAPVNVIVEPPKPVVMQHTSSSIERPPAAAPIKKEVNKSPTIKSKPAVEPKQTHVPRTPEQAPAPSTKPTSSEQDVRLTTLIALCQNYLNHLGQPATTDTSANKKLNIVKSMMLCLENPCLPNASQKIRNMKMVLTEENKETLAAQRSGMGIKFLETLLHVLTAGLFAKYSKNTFAFWKSHGEALGDNIEQLTRDNNAALKL